MRLFNIFRKSDKAFRDMVVLQPGTYRLSAPITLPASQVIESGLRLKKSRWPRDLAGSRAVIHHLV